MKPTQNKFGLMALAIAWCILFSGFAIAQEEEQENTELQKTMPIQITFISPMGTNGIYSGQVANNVSINILAGISGGVRGVELGGLANISKGDIIGFQAAGLANAGLGYVTGVQLAGLANYNKEFVHGLQAAGLINFTKDEFEGLQLAGLANGNTQNTKGVQVAGLVNTSTKIMEGVQVAGITNVALKELNGFQLGLINFAGKLNGFQLGLINVADSVGKGAGLGLITYYRNGYHTFELETNETFRVNATFKSGVNKFYMIYTVGFKTDNNKSYWAPGIGFGGHFPISQKLALNTDLITSHVHEDVWWTKELNLLNTLKVDVGYKLSDKLSVYGGPSFNVVVSGITDEEGNVIGDSFSPWNFYDKTYSNKRVKMYFGFNAGLRF